MTIHMKAFEKYICSADYFQHFCDVNFVKGIGIR